jgi:hypothetical protein
MDTGRPPQEAFELVAGLQEAEAYYKILSKLDEAQDFHRPLLVGRFKWLRHAEYVLAGTILLAPSNRRAKHHGCGGSGSDSCSISDTTR